MSCKNTWRKEGSKLSFGLILFLSSNHVEGRSGQSCCRLNIPLNVPSEAVEKKIL